MTMWVRKSEVPWYQNLCLNIIRQGPIPKHVGLILDGNRRFAKKLGEKTMNGHRKGTDKLLHMLRVCQDLGIAEVTNYAFSIENFKRSKEEVDGLFGLLEEKIMGLLGDLDILNEEGVGFHLIGDWSLIPPSVMKISAALIMATRNNTKFKCNMAIAYTSRNEVSRGVQVIHEGIKSGQLLLDDFDEDLLTQTFAISDSLPLDLIVRTSGETRFSDFLLWQGSESILCFLGVLWPEISAWTMMTAILQYQKNCFMKRKLNLQKESSNIDQNSKLRQYNFLAKLRKDKWDWLEKLHENNR